MADTFFGFDTSLSNLNDDEGGGEPSEDEYDALNDETFGQDSDALDWEVEHEQLAEQLESSRRHQPQDQQQASLEASLSQLVLDEPAVQSRTLGSSVWRHDLPFAPTPVPALKNVCTVEELERRLRQHPAPTHNLYQPRFPPVILQRPPGLQAPVPLPFAPQQNVQHNMNQMNQPLNKIIGQNNQMNQNNMVQNQMGQSMNQMGQNMNQMGQNVNQFMQNVNQMNNFQNNQMMQNNMMSMQQNMQVHQMNQHGQNQMGQNVNQMGQNLNQMGQNVNQMGQNLQIGQNMNQMSTNVNHMGQNMNQMNQNVNQMGQNMNQMLQNGNQFNPNMNQFPHMMGQARMMAPPPGINMPRPGQNFSQNVGQFNPNFRGPISGKNEPMNQQNMLINQHMNQQPLKHQSTQINQKTQNQISPQKNQQKPDLKNQQKTPPQKSRVYNNSKNLSSQNLVQLIQSTHPMLQFNPGLHNANHHPMLQRHFGAPGPMPLGGNRPNGTYANQHHLNGDDGSSCSESDDYAGLMTPREKQWLINIQMLQLSSGTPYIHDFYYTVFLERRANRDKGAVKEAHQANQQNHPFYTHADGRERERERERERHNSARLAGDEAPRTYAPLQFENSLGKLQCGSVTAPRKIIDVEVVGGENTPRTAAPTPAPADIPRDIRRTKQLLLDIEALYLILLRLEELNDPLAISTALVLKEREEKARQAESAASKEGESDSNAFLRHIEAVQRRSPPHDKRQVVSLEAATATSGTRKNLLDEDRSQLCAQLWAGLLHDRLPALLAVRKGRTLVTRFLSVRQSGGGSATRARALWARILRALPAAARRDPAALAPFAPHAHTYFSSAGWPAVLEAANIIAESLDPQKPHALATPLTLSCVCSLIERATLLVNTPEATANERQWYKFLKSLARALKNTTTVPIARPVTPLPEPKLRQHLKQLESRSTVEILQRGKTASEFADLTKNEIMELLVKYLC